MFRIFSLHVGTVFLEEEEPLFVFYLEGERSKVLVDAGLPEAKLAYERSHTRAEGGGPAPIIAGLAECGVTPAEIDRLILTHLHFDHAWNLALFPRAQIVVQRDELMQSIKPEPMMRGYYTRDINVQLVGRRQPDELLILEGDAQLEPGLELLLCPGHTPGSQAVLVQTARGTVALCGDVGGSYGHWFPADPRATATPAPYLRDSFYLPVLRTESDRVCCASMARLRERADIVVPAHDWRIPRRIPDEWWAIPEPVTPTP